MNENNTAAETVEIKTAEPKAKLTPAEKRAKRAAYARDYYKKHTAERIAAAKKCRAAKKARIAAEKAAETQQAEQPAETIVKGNGIAVSVAA